MSLLMFTNVTNHDIVSLTLQHQDQGFQGALFGFEVFEAMCD